MKSITKNDKNGQISKSDHNNHTNFYRKANNKVASIISCPIVTMDSPMFAIFLDDEVGWPWPKVSLPHGFLNSGLYLI